MLIGRGSSLVSLKVSSEDGEVMKLTKFTGPWFAWANSVFAQTILDLAERKPHLLFGKGAEAYRID